VDILGELSARAARSGLFLDFDGTLSEIAPTPDAAVAAPGAAEVLTRLARRFRVVAVVSGRRVAEVRHRLGDPHDVRLFGLYGLEGGDEADGRAIESGTRAVEEILPRVLELAASVPGVLVEPKGSNLAVHYRLVADPEETHVAVLDALRPLARAVGLRVVEGKRVVELVPLSSPTKGHLLRRESSGLEGVLYAGDDLADLEAFAAVDDLAAAGAYGVKVAVRSAEAPGELVRSAHLVAEGPSDLVELLRGLAA
jgi:trehalose 6-phosphate phosphatase